ncbi:hypothetical protein ACI782_11970 [Geodermatophilus sp. SYSU D00703]
MVTLASCDKTSPAHLMAAGRLDVPTPARCRRTARPCGTPSPAPGRASSSWSPRG